MLRRVFANWQLTMGLPVFALVLLMAVFAPVLATHDHVSTDMQRRFYPPGTRYVYVNDAGQEASGMNILGTDELGRDIFSRIVFGARVSMTVSLTAISLAAFIGIVIGLVTGYYGGVADTIIMRIIDVIMALPGMLIALFIIAVFNPSINSVIMAITVGSVPTFARIVRGSVMSARKLEYIDAIKAVGASDARVLFRHILPNILSPIIVQFSLSVGAAIVVTAALSFLGVGIQAPTPEWGAMLQNGRQDMWRAQHLVLIPGTMIFIVVLSVNLIGDGLRLALEPKKSR